MQNINGVFCFIIIIVIAIIFQIYINKSINDDLFNGFWKCDNSFLQDAELTSYVLYISPLKWGTRACYILAENNDELIINEPATLSINIKPSQITKFIGFGLNKTEYTMEFSDLETDDLPKKLNMTFDPSVGKMVLSDITDNTVYAIFFKDSILTDASCKKVI